MDHVFEYLVFLAQAVTVVIAILVVVSAVVSTRMRMQHQEKGHLEIGKLNDGLTALKHDIQAAVLEPGAFKKQLKEEVKSDKKSSKQKAKLQQKTAKVDSAESAESAETSKRLFVLDFMGDLQASRVKDLATEITAVLTLARPSDEVLVRVESQGGLVHAYGLAASQLVRIKQHNVPLVVAVDKVAASGGYLMAAVADKVLAAPFAVMGSIGVVAQIPNFHRLLKKHDVDVEVLTAGKYKRTLTMLGENTEEGRQKFVSELEDVHELFKEFVASHRPQVDLEQVATGETWYGQRAIDVKLVDEIVTSDEYLTQACQAADVYRVQWIEHKKPIERLIARAEAHIQRWFRHS
jgi:serine protease SohB